MTPLLEFREVAFSYPVADRARRQPFVLTDLTFAVRPGEVMGVIGPNSAGKTTVIRLLTRVAEPLRGDIKLDGTSLTRLARWELARQVAVVPQDLPLALPFTVEQLVLMGRYPHAPRRFFETSVDLEVARGAMALTGVLDLARVPVAALSGGERQRVALARALAQQPRLLVLDEPTAHLDLRYQAECVTLLRQVRAEHGTTIVLVSHDLNLAGEVADRLLLLAEGRLARLGNPQHVLEPELLARIYGCEVSVEASPTTGRPQVQVVWPSAAGKEVRDRASRESPRNQGSR